MNFVDAWEIVKAGGKVKRPHHRRYLHEIDDEYWWSREGHLKEKSAKVSIFSDDRNARDWEQVE